MRAPRGVAVVASSSTICSSSALRCPRLAAARDGIARTLQLDVTTEGIESEVEQDILISLGCLYGQGFLLAMPLAPAEAEAMVADGLSVVPELPRLRSLAPLL